VSGRVTIKFDPAEGAVLRMLGLVERRGFEVCGMSMIRQAGQGLLNLDVEPRGPGRHFDVLEGQLRRLVEVRSVSCSATPAGIIP
jgi:acetolactate synthase regulatory subunit